MPAILPGPEDRVTIHYGANPNAPIIYLYGWTGCTPKHISKYADFYARQG